MTLLLFLLLLFHDFCNILMYQYKDVHYFSLFIHMLYILLIFFIYSNIGTENELHESGKIVLFIIPLYSRDIIIWDKWLKNNEKTCANIQYKLNWELSILLAYAIKEDDTLKTDNLEWPNQSFQGRLLCYHLLDLRICMQWKLGKIRQLSIRRW